MGTLVSVLAVIGAAFVLFWVAYVIVALVVLIRWK